MERYEILVIGGGPAAISLAKVVAGSFRTALIRPEDHSLIYCAMPYAVENLVPMGKTFKKDELVTDSGARLIRDTVVSVDFASSTVGMAAGAAIGYERLVIATGAVPIVPPIPGRDLGGVFTFKTEADMRAISGAIEAGARKAAVIGAGAIGIELAQALAARGLETHLVDIAPSIIPNLADPEMVEDAREELARMGIRLHLGHGVVELRGKESVEAIVLDKGEPIALVADAECAAEDEAPPIVVFAVGMRADTALFKDGHLEIDRLGIVVNARMETSIPSVYAIGDCAHFRSGITGEPLPGKLATNAVPMGRILGRRLLGEDVEYRGFYNGAATKIGSWYVGGVGFTESTARARFDVLVGEADLTTTFPIMPSAKPARMKLVVDSKTGLLVGAQVVSGAPVTDKVDQLTMAIQYGIPVKDLRDFSYASQPYQSYYPADNLIVHAIRNLK